MKADQPASIPIALAGTLSTGVALLAVFLPNLDLATQTLIIAFGNSVIGLGVAVWLNRRTTSVDNPVLAAGTGVAVKGTEDQVIVAPTPPGPVGVEGSTDTATEYDDQPAT